MHQFSSREKVVRLNQIAASGVFAFLAMSVVAPASVLAQSAPLKCNTVVDSTGKPVIAANNTAVLHAGSYDCPPPPAAATPSAAVPPAAPLANAVYFVFFDFDKSAITPAAQDILNTVVSDGYAWTVGASYNYGPYGVALTFMDARNSDCNTTAIQIGACGSRDRNTVLVLNGSYQLGPGVFWEVGAFHAKITGNEWNNGTFVGTTPVGVAVATTASGVAQSGLQSNRANGVWTGLAIVF